MLQIVHPAQFFGNQKVMKISGVAGKTCPGLEGAGLKGVMVVFSSENAEFLNGEEREQLMKIIGACKLKEEDVMLVNTAFGKNVNFSWLKNKFNAKVMILFGDVALSNNLLVKKHRAYTIDGVRLVKSEDLSKLLKSQPDKKALWDELRKIFGI
jgi:hypothetical protein